jgi:hypothetical protein
MVNFSDVVVFAEAHRGCGPVTPAVTSQPSGAYTLTLRCACGASHERRVSAEEAAHAPVTAGGARSATPPPQERPRVAPSPDLLRVMQEAIDAEEAAGGSATSSTPTTPAPTTPPPAKRVVPVAPMTNVDDTVLAALRDHDHRRAITGERAGGAGAPLAPPKPRTMWLALAALALLVAVGAAVYVIDAPDGDVPATSGVVRTVQ